MNCKQFPNPNNNPWIIKYNELVLEIKSKEAEYKEFKKTQPKRNDREYQGNYIGVHHIIPKKIQPELVKDKENLLYVPFVDHMNLHYYLWKADYRYSLHLMFGAAFGRKHKIWDLPNGDEDWKLLQKDCARARKEIKENKNKQ